MEFVLAIIIYIKNSV